MQVGGHDITVHGHGRFEEAGSYCRVRRVGDHVFVAGTTAVEPSGRLHAPGDSYAQTRYVLELLSGYLEEVGSSLRDVVRTRCYLASLSDAAGFVRAHGEVFAGIDPVTTAVTSALTTEGMCVEIEMEAIVRERPAVS